MSVKESVKFKLLGIALGLLLVVSPVGASAAARKTVKRYGTACNCVSYARAMTGKVVRTANGRAITHPINSRKPRLGSIVVLREGPIGHVAVVRGITNTHIVVSEANYRRCQITSGRAIPINSGKIRGYWT